MKLKEWAASLFPKKIQEKIAETPALLPQLLAGIVVCVFAIGLTTYSVLAYYGQTHKQIPVVVSSASALPAASVLPPVVSTPCTVAPP